MRGHFVHPFDDDGSSPATDDRGAGDPRGPADVDAVVAAVGGGGLLSGIDTVIGPAARRQATPPSRNRGAARRCRAARRSRATSTSGQASFVDGAGGKSVLPTMWPLLKDLVDGSMVVPLDEIAAAMRTAADRVHVVAEGAGGTARRGGAQRPRRHRQDRRGRLRRQHRSVALRRTRQLLTPALL